LLLTLSGCGAFTNIFVVNFVNNQFVTSKLDGSQAVNLGNLAGALSEPRGILLD